MSDVAENEESLPETRELILATVTKITDYGAYVSLDEYKGVEGFLHISELSSTWVKNIRDFAREKQKTVLKVLRVDHEKRQIDLSLKRVSGRERQDKLLNWKRQRKAISLLQVTAEKLKLDPEKFVDEILEKLETKFGEAYKGLEELAEKGQEAADRLNISPDWTKALIEIANQKIKLQTVKIKGILELTSTDPDGIKKIKAILTQCSTLKRAKETKVEIYTIGAPRYAVEVTAKNYKDAEKTVQEIGDYAVQEIKKTGGQSKYMRKI
ncbi:MAG: translation initiation factor IF-2 subunit alpha [Candidatus Bathyarchaeota archaeon]